MNKKNNKRKIKAAVITALIIGLLFFVWKIGKPAYDRYIAADYADTCEKVRFVITLRYNDAIQAAVEQAGAEEDKDNKDNKDDENNENNTDAIDYNAMLEEALKSMQDTFPRTEISKEKRKTSKEEETAEDTTIVNADEAAKEYIWTVRNLCRSKGVYTITIQPDHKLEIDCSVHGEYRQE